MQTFNPPLVAAAALLSAAAWAANPAGQPCASECRIFQSTQGYPHLVVGVIENALDDAQSRALYQAGLQKQPWKTLGASADEFVRFVKPVVIRPQDGAASAPAYLVLMGQDEYAPGALQPGDLVRYSPHPASHPKPAEGTAASQAFWQLYGCVAVLCKAGDAACFASYRQGLFSKQSGQALSHASETPLPKGPVIDTTSMLPVE
ncbi:MAG: hypothetical protein LBP52_02450, partial [Burkholderiaceae bacterium]|nr:hypothetical protein [Burkholderiaceae bacterium]